MSKRLLVIGGGGREAAIVDALEESEDVSMIYCAPGNPGMKTRGKVRVELVDIPVGDLTKLRDFAVENDIDLTIVGPEAPLVAGIVDLFEAAQLRIFGCTRRAADLEGSKVFSKNLMVNNNIPTARHVSFSDPDAAKKHIEGLAKPPVVKADGLAAGKGAIVAKTIAEALEAVDRIMVKKEFGDAGNRIVVEDREEGFEVSCTFLTDGEHVLAFPEAMDHKQAHDGDQGENTGGMGACAPVPKFTPQMKEEVLQTIVKPVLRAMSAMGRKFKGVLYVGLMVTKQGPKVLEFNIRFGDPEAKPILWLLKSKLLPLLEAVVDGTLEAQKPDWWEGESVVYVVLATPGYPGGNLPSLEITGLDDALDTVGTGVKVIQAGTQVVNGKLCTKGGRNLGICAKGPMVEGNPYGAARDLIYPFVEKIRFGGKPPMFRTDIPRQV